MRSMTDAMMGLEETGEVMVENNSGGPRALFEVCSLSERMAFDKAAGGMAFAEL